MRFWTGKNYLFWWQDNYDLTTFIKLGGTLKAVLSFHAVGGIEKAYAAPFCLQFGQNFIRDYHYDRQNSELSVFLQFGPCSALFTEVRTNGELCRKVIVNKCIGSFQNSSKEHLKNDFLNPKEYCHAEEYLKTIEIIMCTSHFQFGFLMPFVTHL